MIRGTQRAVSSEEVTTSALFCSYLDTGIRFYQIVSTVLLLTHLGIVWIIELLKHVAVLAQ